MADLRRKFFEALEQELNGGYPGVVRAGGMSFGRLLRWFRQFGDEPTEVLVKKGKESVMDQGVRRAAKKPATEELVGEAEDLITEADERYLQEQAATLRRAQKEPVGVEFETRDTETFGEITEAKRVTKVVGEDAPYVHAAVYALDNMQSADDVLEAIRAGVAAEPKLVVPWKTTQEAAEALARDGALNPASVMNWVRQNGLSTPQLAYADALIKESEAIARETMELFAEKLARDELSDADRALALGMICRHASLQKTYSGMRSEGGRLLNILRSTRTPKLPPGTRQTMIKMFGGDKRIQEIVEVLNDMETPEQFNRAVREFTRPGAKEMTREIWLNGILSGPRTHQVNLLGSGFATMFSNIDEFTAGLIGDARLLTARAVGSELTDYASVSDMVPLLYGELRGTLDGVRLFARSVRKGVSVLDPVVKIDTSGGLLSAAGSPAVTTANLAEMVGLRPPTGSLAQGLDYVFDGMRLPTRFLTGEDDLFKSINYRGTAYAEAYRMARKEAKQQGVENVGEYMGKRIPELMDEMPQELHEAAMKMARYNTFTEQLTGGWGEMEKVLSGLRRVPIVGYYVVPFRRTPICIAKWTFEHTPLALADSAVIKSLKAGGRARDVALAKIATGSTFMTLAGILAMGGFITGAGPDWKTQRGTADALLRVGRTKRSLRIPAGYAGNDKDEYYDISRLDPVGMLLTTVADTIDLMRYAPDDATADEIAMMMTIALAENFSDKAYMTGVAEFFDAWVSDPRRFVQGWTERMAGSFVPTIVTDVNRHFFDQTRREIDGIVESYKSRLPGISKGLPPRRNLWGYPIELDEFNMFSPIQKSTLKMEKYSPLDQLIIKNRMNIAPPSPNWNGLDLRQYTKVEGKGLRNAYDRYMELAGHALTDPATGINLVDSLLGVIENSERYPDLYTSGPDGTLRDSFRMEINAYRALARDQLLEEFPDLARDVMTRQEAMDAAKGFVTGD